MPTAKVSPDSWQTIAIGRSGGQEPSLKPSDNLLNFTLDDCDFQVREVLYDAIRLRLIKNGDSSAGFVRLIPFTNDSIRVELSSQLDARPDPFSRISAYLRGKRIEKAFDDIVLSLSKYASEGKNIYGIDIKNEKVQYQNLVSTKAVILSLSYHR